MQKLIRTVLREDGFGAMFEECSLKNKKLHVLLFFEAVVIFGIHIFNNGKLYGFFLTEDELGYWGNAAYMLGKDWGNVVSFCPYYSYGYSFFLMLILSLPVQPLSAYRLAIAANGLFMAAVFGISYYLFTRVFPKKNKIVMSIFCMAMSLCASYVAQSSVAWSECYLVLLVWLIILQAYLVCEKTTLPRLLVLAVEAVYLYMIHQRTVGFMISTVIFIGIWAIRHKKISTLKTIVIVLVMGGLLLAAILLKNHIQSAIYGSGDLLNTYSGVLKSLKISTLFIPVIKTACGQMFYLWASSFGIVPLGIAATIYMCIKNWKTKNRLCYFYGFILLSFLGIFAVSCIWMSLRNSLLDYYMYGRFNEIITGFFIIVGFIALSYFVKQKKGWIIFGISTILLIGLTVVLQSRFHRAPGLYYQGVGAAGLFGLYSLMGYFDARELFLIVFAASLVLFGLGRKFADRKWTFAAEAIVITLFWIWSGESVVQKQIIPYQLGNNYDLAVKDNLLEYIRNEDEVVFLTDTGRYSGRGSIQLYMEDKPLIVIPKSEKLDGKPDILIMDSNVVPDADVLNGYYLTGVISDKKIYSLKEVGLDKSMFSFNQIGSEESGCVMFGPYMSLNPGFYEVTYHMSGNSSIKSEDACLGVADIIADGGSSTISSVEWDGTSQSITMQFHLWEETGNIEFRYFKNEGNDVVPLELTLRNIEEWK